MRNYRLSNASAVSAAVLVGAVLIGIGGCGSAAPKDPGGTAIKGPQGPHGGSLIELVSEDPPVVKYHLEMVHDAATGRVTFYVLDVAAKEEVPISRSSFFVILNRDGNQMQQVRVTAENEKERKNSKFVSINQGLAEALAEGRYDWEFFFILDGMKVLGKLPHTR
jgi:hypothetical protein